MAKQKSKTAATSIKLERKPTAESKMKAKFRTTAAWKKFRTFLKKERKVDELTGKKLLKGFQVHHCCEDIKEYKILEPDRFFVLNKTSHQIVHFLERYDWVKLLLNFALIEHKMDYYNKRERSESSKKLTGIMLKLRNIKTEEALDQISEFISYVQTQELTSGRGNKTT